MELVCCQQAFEKLKLALVGAPVLAIPDPTAPFDLITDSCGYGVGAVLMQHENLLLL